METTHADSCWKARAPGYKNDGGAWCSCPPRTPPAVLPAARRAMPHGPARTPNPIIKASCSNPELRNRPRIQLPLRFLNAAPARTSNNTLHMCVLLRASFTVADDSNLPKPSSLL